MRIPMKMEMDSHTVRVTVMILMVKYTLVLLRNATVRIMTAMRLQMRKML